MTQFGILIACPIAYIFLYNWLDGFVVKTSPSPWVFLMAGVISALVALLTVSYQNLENGNGKSYRIIKNRIGTCTVPGMYLRRTCSVLSSVRSTSERRKYGVCTEQVHLGCGVDRVKTGISSCTD
ncbi:hypothetical protein [uncultured Bacteroides sp.]|uniref:hypothetical protein n=1 Tax=uncultured Bacteroides sp. TaxID=162156 RepID=UPI0025D02144|nr:hypothetical protein [uncultured Bacteroides sp.]